MMLNYACFVLRDFHILPSQLAKMSANERALIFAAVDINIEAKKGG